MKRYKSRALEILIGITIVTGVFFGSLGITQAITASDKVNVILTIGSNGKITCEGDLFGKELWYPGKVEKGIIRIENKFRRVSVTDLALDAELLNSSLGYDKDKVYNSFLNNMRLTVSKGRFLVFSDTIVDNKSFAELLYKKDGDETSGFGLKDSDRFSIGKSESADLKYTMSMDMNAGNDLQDIEAKVDFILGTQE